MLSVQNQYIQQEIADVSMKRPHVVILGAGASIAALPHGDVKGKKVPAMKNLIQCVGLEQMLKSEKNKFTNKNFEEVYSHISSDKNKKSLLKKIESKIYHYFSNLEYPYKPTKYDHLILSLRETDLIATFNWDPFLMEAYRRNKDHFRLPRIVFLHGNVSVGYCKKDKVKGLNGYQCPKCSKLFTPSPLLFPVTRKNYNNDPLIDNEWKILSSYLETAFMITIFGYRAPKSDVEAKNIMIKAWGEVEKRNMEQIEVIVKPGTSEEKTRKNWDKFIHTHHYDVIDDFYDSWIANHPRRTGEAYVNQYIKAMFIDNHPIPKDFSYLEIWNWLKPLKLVEEK